MSGETSAEERIVGYGQRAVDSGTRVARAPAKKPPGAAPPSVPPHVAQARRVWAASFAKGRPTVVIHDIGVAPSRLIRSSSFDAWTNSSTRVYVNKTAAANAGTMLAVLHHEALHVDQFVGNRNARPADHEAMMRFERDAYGTSATWSKAHADPEVRAHHATFDAAHRLFRDEIDRVVNDPNIPASARNAEYKAFMVKQGLLPPHSTIADLYT